MGIDYESEEDDFYSDENLEKIGDDVEIQNEVKTPPFEGDVIENEDTGIEEDGTEEEVQPKSYSLNMGVDLEIEDDDDVSEEEIQPRSYSYSSDLELEVEDDDGEDDVLSPEERLRGFADKLISCCFGDKSIRTYALDKMMLFASPQLFRDENFILYSVLYTYRGRIKQIRLDEEFLKLFLNRNRGMIEKSRGFIDINAYGEIDGSVELGYISGVIKHFKRLVSMEELDETEFETLFEKYLIEYKTLEAQRVIKQAQVILLEGLTISRKRYFGFEDSSNFLRRRMAEIEGITDLQKGAGFITAREMLLEEKPQNKSYKVSDFDEITVLNEMYGGIYTAMFYQFLAPPKTGKSKLCARIVHTTVVKFCNNVTVWAQEGGKEAFLAQLRAIHFDYIYNTGVGIAEKKFGVSQDAILHDKFPSEELRQLELSSKLEFASNQDYGSIDFIDKPFEVETFIEDIQTSVKSNNSTLVVIDYLQLIGSATNKTERECVAKAYQLLLNYCKSANVAVLSPGQYKQEVIDRLIQSSSSGSNTEMRTAGGTSSEVIKTPDILFALWASTEDIANNSEKLISLPSRFSKVFPDTDLVVDLESCHFISV